MNKPLGRAVVNPAGSVRAEDALLIQGERKPIVRVEIARSFSYKLDMKRFDPTWYENRDFFASRKSECAIEDEHEVSVRLYESCKAEVMEAVAEYIQELRRRIATRKTA